MLGNVEVGTESHQPSPGRHRGAEASGVSGVHKKEFSESIKRRRITNKPGLRGGYDQKVYAGHVDDSHFAEQRKSG